MKPVCRVEGCGRTSYYRQLCRPHYERDRRYGSPLGGLRVKGEALRFLRETVLAYEGDDCLIWPFNRAGNGGAIVYQDGHTRSAARIVCEAVNGSPPTPDHQAAHNCGKGHEGCVAPKHLRWATAKENAADKLIHGTQTWGRDHPASKIDEHTARLIKAHKGLLSQREIARKYSVARATVRRIHDGKCWRRA